MFTEPCSRPAFPLELPRRLSTLERFTPVVLLLLASAYSALFIPPNLVGAADHDMLAFASGNVDNIHMYDCLLRMRPGSSLSATLHNFLYYDWYYYGYPFFLFSRLATLPSTLLIRSKLIDPANAVLLHIMAVKELGSLYIVLASGVLVYMWTGFKALFQSAFLLIFLLAIPLVFEFNMVWHPESLATLFVVFTILALAKDALRFGRWFYLAALACGCAVGIKAIGVFFFPSIVVYLVLGWLKHFKPQAENPITPDSLAFSPSVLESATATRLGWFNAAGDAATFFIKYGTRFVLLMIVAVVITNPLMLLPEMLNQYVTFAKASIEWGREGFLLNQLMQPESTKSWYGVLSEHCGRWWMFVLVGAVSIFGIASDYRTRLLNIVIMTWTLPFAMYLMWSGPPDRPYYFLSVALPLMSCIGSPAIWRWWTHREAFRRRCALLLLVSTLALCGLEAKDHINVDLGVYKAELEREKNSESVAAGRELDRVYLSRMVQDGTVRILRDDPVGSGSVYIPQVERFDVLQYAGLLNYEDVEKMKPRVIVLLKSSMEFYSSEKFLRHYSGYPKDTLSRSFGHPFVRASYQFYRDAKEKKLNAFHPVWGNDFAAAFERE